MSNQGLTLDLRLAGVERSRQARRLGHHHFAFFRAFVEGLPFDQIAARYLETGTNRRAARATLQWVIDELTAAARRQRPAVARLLRISPGRLEPPAEPAAEPQPMTLDDFRVERDPDGFYSENELIELFELEISAGVAPAVRRQAARNARLRARQLEAVRWLESWIAVAPKAEDPLSAWLDPVIASRLDQGGIQTVGQLIDIINLRGRRWWSKIPRLGPEGASRLITWLNMNRVAIGAGIDADALAPYQARQLAQRARRVRTFGVVPLEYLLVPASLSGGAGQNRGAGAGLGAQDDVDAINAWFRSRKNKAHTLRSYRAHVERFVLWSMVERQKPLSALTTQDCIDFRDFLYALDPERKRPWLARLPREAWIGQRGIPRSRSDWRPFAGPPSIDTQNLTRTVCSSMCAWLVRKGYLIENPWEDVEEIGTGSDRILVERSLTLDDWQQCRAYLDSMARDERFFRLRFLLWLAVSCGPRLSEISSSTLQSIRPGPLDPEHGQTWELNVIGKRDRDRPLPLAPAVVDYLKDYLVVRGIEFDNVAWPLNEKHPLASTPLIATLSAHLQAVVPAHAPITADAIYGLLQRFFKKVASRMKENGDGLASGRLSSASTHWLRHSFGTWASNAGMDDRSLMLILGHRSLATTSIYTTTGRQQRQRAVRQLTEELAE